MTNEEKAIEFAENISPYDIGGDNAAHYAAKDAALDAMEWKDEQHAKEKQQWIERVLTILTNWAKKHTKECDGDKFMRMGLTNDLVIYFKKAMKGE